MKVKLIISYIFPHLNIYVDVFFSSLINSFGANGNIEVYADNTDSGESARESAVSPEISFVCRFVFKYISQLFYM